jgi:hypothetical protein
MYRTAYKTLYRVHTVEEALAYDIPKNKTDLFLYLIDVYDVLLSIASNQLTTPSITSIVQMRVKFSTHLLNHYHDMYMPIPGALLGWTESMLLWVIILSVIDMQHWNSTMELSPSVLTWTKKHAIRMFEDPDLTTWNLDTLISQLDCISMKWHELEPCDELEEFLEIMWRFAARFTLRIHSKDVINLENYTEDIAKLVKVRLTPDGIMVFLSRYYWFHHMISLRKKWKTTCNYDVYAFPKMSDTNWDKWILHEKRHFVTRRFRDGICSWMWDKLILFGDQEIASHDQLGDEVSAFTCMYARFPAGLVSLWQRILTYKEYEEIIACEALKNFAHLHMIHAHFSSIYNVSFLKYFFIYDKLIHKHVSAISKASTPLVVYWYNRYVCFFHGKIYKHPEGADMKHAFIMWCYILRKECDGKCYDSMDFNTVCEQILDQAEIVNNDRVVEGFFTLEDD